MSGGVGKLGIEGRGWVLVQPWRFHRSVPHSTKDFSHESM